MSGKNKLFSFIVFVILLLQIRSQTQNQEYLSRKQQIQRQQLAVRDQVGLMYGQNTQTFTFAISYMTDFLVKATQDEQIKATFHIYWKQNNVYVGSEYRQGESVRVLIYEDNYKILFDNKFYVTYGFKIQAQKGKSYTIRFISEGQIHKIATMEISQIIPSKVEQKVNRQSMQYLSRRLDTAASQLKVLSGVSQFAVVMHEKAARGMNHSICIYMSYLIAESVLVLLIIGFQVKMLLKLLNNQSIV